MEENKKHLNSREHFVSTPIYLDIQRAKYKSCTFSCLVHSESFFSCQTLSVNLKIHQNPFADNMCGDYIL